MKVTLGKVVVAAALTGLMAGCAANAGHADHQGSHAGHKPRAEKMFQRFDANNDGQITRDEARAKAAEKFARMDVNRDGIATPEERHAARATRKAERFSLMDTNRDGLLSLDEMKATMAQRAERRFSHLDTNADGGVSLAEMQAGKGKRHRGHKGKGPITAQELDARIMHMFERADADKNGVITLDEAKRMGRHGRRG